MDVVAAAVAAERAGTRVDQRMTALCSNMQIDTDGTGQSAVLPACATDASHFFVLTQPSQIAAAFQQIGVDI